MSDVKLNKEQAEAVIFAMSDAYAIVEPASRFCNNPTGPCPLCFKLEEMALKGLDKIKAMEE